MADTQSVIDAIDTPLRADGKGELAVLDKTGDTKLIWDRHNADEVNAAERTFDDLKAKGFTAYSVRKDGEKSEVISSFDSTAERIIMVPRMVGG